MRRSRLAGRLLIGTGVVLLIVGGALGYPYVHSRLVTPSSLTVATLPARLPTATASGSGDLQSIQVVTGTRPHTPRPLSPPSPVAVSASMPTDTPNPPNAEPEETQAAPPTRIVIPALGVDGPVVPVSLDQTEVEGQTRAAWGVPDQYAAGWHESSAALGESGNLVLNGHNTTNGEIFRDLYTLDSGDEIIIYSEEISRTYVVSEILILPEAGQPLEVRLANARYVMPTEDERLTLVTCHPYGSLRNRLIVVARPLGFDRSSEPPED